VEPLTRENLSTCTRSTVSDVLSCSPSENVHVHEDEDVYEDEDEAKRR
jgi:hypothetical protein